MGTINKSAALVTMFLATVGGMFQPKPSSVLYTNNIRNGFRARKRKRFSGKKIKNTNGIYTMNDYSEDQLSAMLKYDRSQGGTKGQLWLACIQNGSVNVFTAPHASRRVG